MDEHVAGDEDADQDVLEQEDPGDTAANVDEADGSDDGDDGVVTGAIAGGVAARLAGPQLKRAVEAIVMVADSPVEVGVLAQLVEVAPRDVDQVLAELADEYRTAGRGFELVAVAGGWRFQSHPDQAPYVERFVLEGQTAKLSAAALETLAIVAYKQPISRAQVATIRGVSVDGVVRTLEQRGYITEVARDPGPGQAVLFGTTPLFLDKLGLSSLSDLPAIADFVPGADVVEALEHGLRVEDPAGQASPGPLSAADGLDAEIADDLGRASLGAFDVHPVADLEAPVTSTTPAVDIDLRDEAADKGQAPGGLAAGPPASHAGHDDGPARDRWSGDPVDDPDHLDEGDEVDAVDAVDDPADPAAGGLTDDGHDDDGHEDDDQTALDRVADGADVDPTWGDGLDVDPAGVDPSEGAGDGVQGVEPAPGAAPEPWA